MNSTIKLLTVKGIAIRLHITFPLILVWAAIQFGILSGAGLTGAVFGVIVVSLLFVIVTLHELGHSQAALYHDVSVREIVLLPIGGVAQLERLPENPWQEFVIAIAGPAVNFAIAGLMIVVAAVLRINLLQALPDVVTLSGITFTAVFSYLFIYNLFLGVFNLLPAFPMDGGRVLRALLATRLPYVRATSIAVGVGRSMAWLMGLYGFLNGGFSLILIAIFIYIGASQEEEMVKARALLRGLIVRQAYSSQTHSLRPDDTLKDATRLTLTTFQSSFPVCDSNELLGLLPYHRLIEALESKGQDTPVGEVMDRDIPAVSLHDELFNVQQLFAQHHTDALPVVENGRFVGLITTHDVAEVYRLLSVAPNLLPRAGAA